MKEEPMSRAGSSHNGFTIHGDRAVMGELVSESEVGVELEDVEEVVKPRGGSLDLANQVRAHLESEGFEVLENSLGLVFHLPAGRSTRPVRIAKEDYEEILRIRFGGWRSLSKVDGVYHQGDGVIEVALRSDMPTGLVMRKIARMTGQNSDIREDLQDVELKVTDPRSSVTLRVGSGSRLASILLGPRRFLRARRPLTVRLESVRFVSTDEAEELMESITDSLTLQTGLLWGVPLSPQRLDMSTPVERQRRRREQGGDLSFPSGRYPHAPIALYRMGKDRRSSPLFRYWAYYQVLEYFFPIHSRSLAVSRLAKAVRSPLFDPYKDEDVVDLLSVIDGDSARLSEQEQLKLTLQSIVSEEALVTTLLKLGLEDVLRKKSEGLSREFVNLTAGSSVIQQLSSRIYDVRCRIVHSKSASQRELGPGLLPGTADEELAEVELPILEYLAEQALESVASRLDLRPWAQEESLEEAEVVN